MKIDKLCMLVFLVVLLLGCQTEGVKPVQSSTVEQYSGKPFTLEIASFSKYDYVDDFKYYWKTEFSEYPLNGVDTLIVIPLNSCGSCVYRTFEVCAKNIAQNYDVLISGDTAIYNKYHEQIEAIGATHNIQLDQNMSMNKYLLNITGPVILVLDDSPMIFNLSVERWEEIIPILHWKG